MWSSLAASPASRTPLLVFTPRWYPPSRRIFSKVSPVAKPRAWLSAGFLSAVARLNPPIAVRVHATPAFFRKFLRSCAMEVLLFRGFNSYFGGLQARDYTASISRMHAPGWKGRELNISGALSLDNRDEFRIVGEKSGGGQAAEQLRPHRLAREDALEERQRFLGAAAGDQHNGVPEDHFHLVGQDFLGFAVFAHGAIPIFFRRAGIAVLHVLVCAMLAHQRFNSLMGSLESSTRRSTILSAQGRPVDFA